MRPVEWVHGDLGDLPSLKRAMEGMEMLVNIASIGFGHAPNIVGAASASGIGRAVFISTTAIFTTLPASSRTVRMAAEEAIRSSGLAYTILRPTMIYGSSRDRNVCRLIRYLQRWPAIPVFGSGKNLQQPVYVGDVAQAVVDCLSSDRAVGKSYNIPGAEALSYNQVIDTICRLVRRKVVKVHLPVLPVVSALSICEGRGWPVPIKAEQILRLNEDKVFDSKEACLDFGYSPPAFGEGIGLELRQMMNGGYRRGSQ
jgi:nucleoside-diphosphate-sugar epimerase